MSGKEIIQHTSRSSPGTPTFFAYFVVKLIVVSDTAYDIRTASLKIVATISQPSWLLNLQNHCTSTQVMPQVKAMLRNGMSQNGSGKKTTGMSVATLILHRLPGPLLSTFAQDITPKPKMYLEPREGFILVPTRTLCCQDMVAGLCPGLGPCLF